MLEYVVSDVCGLGLFCQVNEPDHTVVPDEIRKADDAGEVVEGKAPINHEVNGDVEGAVSGGFEGADLDPTDQTLVADLSQEADVSVVQETAVSGIPVWGLSPCLFLAPGSTRCAGFVFLHFVFFVPRFLG